MATPAFPDLYARARNSVKRRVARWPSAYASAQLVREYKALVSARHGSRAQPYEAAPRPSGLSSGLSGLSSGLSGLSRWFAEKWVNISTMKPCGSVKSSSYYPVCRPERIARRLTLAQIADAVARKQKARSATARYARNFTQGKLSGKGRASERHG